MNFKEDWHIILVIAVSVFALFTIAVCIADISVNGIADHDGRPDWANDTARQLDTKGGRIWLYNENGSSATTVDYFVRTEYDVYADSIGIVVKNGSTITQYPYDRIQSIYVGGY